MGRKVVRTHFDLDVYQRAFDGAMQIFELSRRFPAEERYSLTAKFAGRPAASVRTLPKPGASDGTRRLLSVSYPTRKPRPPKPKRGSNFQAIAIISNLKSLSS